MPVSKNEAGLVEAALGYLQSVVAYERAAPISVFVAPSANAFDLRVVMEERHRLLLDAAAVVEAEQDGAQFSRGR